MSANTKHFHFQMLRRLAQQNNYIYIRTNSRVTRKTTMSVNMIFSLGFAASCVIQRILLKN